MNPRPSSPTAPAPHLVERERSVLVRQLERWLEVPMLVLGFVWLALLVVEFTAGLSPALETLSMAIWAIFIADFALKFAVAPRKLQFLRKQWLTALSLLLPALRVLRIVRVARVLRAARAARGVRLFRLVSSLNRGLRALRGSMGRRGFGYVAVLTAVVTFAGAAGMVAFEGDEQPGLPTYGAALWWTAMMMTTVGSDYFPRSPEGRLLCLLLAAFAFAVWGYLTATLATFFVGRDADNEKAEIAGAKSIEQLREEIRALREAVETLALRSTETERTS